MRFRMCKLLMCVVFSRALGFGQSDAEIRQEADRIFAKYGSSTPGVAVGILREGKVALVQGYGMASLEHGISIGKDTVFQVGSVSKQFTAFAVYLLERQGKLSLQDDVRKYVPEVPDYGKPLRIQHLLAHSSGIRDQAALLSLAGWRMDDVMTTAQVLRVIGRQSELNFEPGSAYLYCNTGYTLLSEVVRRVSGVSFAEFTKRNIFEPLRMKDTQFLEDHETVIKNRADSYEYEGGVYKRVNLNDAVAGPSNLYTTAGDMLRWALNLQDPTVGDREMIRRFNEASVLNNGEKTVYYSLPGDIGYHAKGQIQKVYRGLEVWSHGGHAGGFRSTFWRFPGQGFAVVLLSNDENFPQLQNAEALIDFCLREQLRPRHETVSSAASAQSTAVTPHLELEEFEGTYYNSEIEARYTTKVRNGKLTLLHLRHGEIPLEVLGKDRFSGRIEFPVQCEFLRDAAGKVTGLRISNFGAKNVKFQRSFGT